MALESGDRRVPALIEVAFRTRTPVRTSAAAVAQTWRDGSKQALLANALSGVDVRMLDEHSARAIGELLSLSGSADVVDAHIALLANTGDTVVTSDVGDIHRLCDVRNVLVTVHGV
jgi:uncharacterized protein YaiI (UPF0178 family)